MLLMLKIRLKLDFCSKVNKQRAYIAVCVDHLTLFRQRQQGLLPDGPLALYIACGGEGPAGATLSLVKMCAMFI